MAGEAKTTVTDPVCGLEMDPAHAAARLEHEGRQYWFCSQACRAEFRRRPAEYAAGARRPVSRR